MQGAGLISGGCGAFHPAGLGQRGLIGDSAVSRNGSPREASAGSKRRGLTVERRTMDLHSPAAGRTCHESDPSSRCAAATAAGRGLTRSRSTTARERSCRHAELAGAAHPSRACEDRGRDELGMVRRPRRGARWTGQKKVGFGICLRTGTTGTLRRDNLADPSAFVIPG